MRFALAGLLLILIWGCGSTPTPPVQASAAKPEPAASDASGPLTVKLDSGALAKAGIEIGFVSESTGLEAITVPGRLTLNEDRTWHVGSFSTGKIDSVFANLGQVVTAGQVLARLHSHDVHDSRADYAKARAELQTAKANLALAERTRNRMGRLYALKSVSQEQVEASETAFQNAQDQVKRAEAEVTRHRTHLQEFLEVEADAPPGRVDDQDAVPIKAPATAMVMDRRVNPGSVIREGEEAFTLADLSTLWMIAAVNEADLARVRPGAGVLVRVKAFPEQPISGRILRLGEQVDAATRTLQVRILVPNAGQRLRPEMFATAEIGGGPARTALYVPAEAVQEVSGQTAVFVERQAGVFEAQGIEAGSLSGRLVEVRGGLKAGDRVVTRGSFVLKSELLKRSLAEEE